MVLLVQGGPFLVKALHDSYISSTLVLIMPSIPDCLISEINYFSIGDHLSRVTSAILWINEVKAANGSVYPEEISRTKQLPKNIFDISQYRADQLRANYDPLGADIVLTHIGIILDNEGDGR